MERNHIYCSIISDIFLLCYIVYLGYFLSKEEILYFSFLFYFGFSLAVMDVCFFTILKLDIGLFMNIFGFFLFLISFGYICYDIFEHQRPNMLEILSLLYSSFLVTKSIYLQKEDVNNGDVEEGIEYEDLGPV